MSEISFQVSGGLGNQLFCLAAGKFFERVTHTPVGFYFENIKGDRVSDVLDLEGLMGSTMLAKPPGFLERLRNRSLNFRELGHGLASSIYDSKEVGYDPNLLKLTGKKFVRGYFQSHVYASALIAPEANLDQLLIEPSSWYKAMAPAIQGTNVGIVHVRRGDYKNHKSTLGLLGSSYYEELARSFVSHSPAEQWLIFSDDAGFAKDALTRFMPKGTQVIDPPQGIRPIESLVLMSSASHIAISNSTFSWWAAFLGRSKSIVAPKPWFAGLEEPEGLLPQDWQRVDSIWEK